MMPFAWRGRRVLLTGSTGLIGSVLLRWLVEQGAVVVALGRRQPTVDGVRWLPGDLAAGTLPALPACDVVVHAASFRRNARFHREQAAEVHAENVRMTDALLQAITVTPERALFFSTGNIPWPTPDAPPSDGYVSGKIACEAHWQTWAERHSVALAIARPTNVYGPGDQPGPDANVVPALYWRLTQGESPLRVQAPAELSRPFLYVRDTALAAVHLVQAVPANGLLSYVVPPQEYALSELVALLQRYCHTDVPVEFSSTITQANRLSYGPVHASLADMTWTSLEDGLAETVARWRAIA